MNYVIRNILIVNLYMFTDHEKVKREQQLFLPVRPDTLFAPYDLHKQGLQKNNCSVRINY